jgi:hypothetical protein
VLWKDVVDAKLQTRREKAAINITVIWNMLPFNLLDRYQHLQRYQLPPSLASAFKTEMMGFSKITANCITSQYQMLDDYNFNIYSCEQLQL